MRPERAIPNPGLSGPVNTVSSHTHVHSSLTNCTVLCTQNKRRYVNRYHEHIAYRDVSAKQNCSSTVGLLLLSVLSWELCETDADRTLNPDFFIQSLPT